MVKVIFSNKLKQNFHVWEAAFLKNLNKILLVGERNIASVQNIAIHENNDAIYIKLAEESSIETLKDGRSFRRFALTKNKRLCICSFSGNIQIYSYNENIGSFEYQSLLEGPKAELKSVSLNYNDSLLCAAARDKNIWIWKLTSDSSSFYQGCKHNSDVEPEYECFYILQGHSGDVKKAIFVNEKNLICSVSYTGEIIFWVQLDESDVNSDEWVSKEIIHTEQKTISKNDPIVMLANKIIEQDLNTERINSLTCHPDEKKTQTNVVYDDKTNITLWNVKSFNIGTKNDELVVVVGDDSTIIPFIVSFDENIMASKLDRLELDLSYIRSSLGNHSIYDLELIHIENTVYNLILVGDIISILTINVRAESVLIERIEKINCELGKVINIDRNNYDSRYFVLTSIHKEIQLMKIY